MTNNVQIIANVFDDVFAMFDAPVALDPDTHYLQTIDANLCAERLDPSLNRNQRRAVALNLMMLRRDFGPYDEGDEPGEGNPRQWQ